MNTEVFIGKIAKNLFNSKKYYKWAQCLEMKMCISCSGMVAAPSLNLSNRHDRCVFTSFCTRCKWPSAVNKKRLNPYDRYTNNTQSTYVSSVYERPKYSFSWRPTCEATKSSKSQDISRGWIERWRKIHAINISFTAIDLPHFIVFVKCQACKTITYLN